MTVDRLSRRDGFSLLETLIALGIIALIVAAMAAAVQTHGKAARASERRQEAVLLAQSLLDQFAGTPAVQAPFNARGAVGSNVWTVGIAPFDAGINAPGLAEVRVRVSWSGEESGMFELKSLRLIVP